MEQFYKFNELNNYPVIIAQLNVSLCSNSVPPGAFDTDQTSTGQTCGRTDQNGKKYAQYHIQAK